MYTRFAILAQGPSRRKKTPGLAGEARPDAGILRGNLLDGEVDALPGKGVGADGRVARPLDMAVHKANVHALVVPPQGVHLVGEPPLVVAPVLDAAILVPPPLAGESG